MLLKFSRIAQGYNIKSSELSTKLEDFVVFVQNFISFTETKKIQKERFFRHASGKQRFLVQQLAIAFLKVDNKYIFLEPDKVTPQEDKNVMCVYSCLLLYLNLVQKLTMAYSLKKVS